MLGVLVTQPITMDQEEETQQEVNHLTSAKTLVQVLDTVSDREDVSVCVTGGYGEDSDKCTGGSGHHLSGAECHDSADSRKSSCQLP